MGRVGTDTLTVPDTEGWLQIAQEFETRWNFPHCLGAIDGKHIAIKAPPNSGSVFFNYKKFFSLVMMGIVDAKYRFTVVDIGAFGSQSDGGVFANSRFGKKLRKGKLQLPAPCSISGRAEVTPYVFVGDEAFPLMFNLMHPFPGNQLDHDK